MLRCAVRRGARGGGATASRPLGAIRFASRATEEACRAIAYRTVGPSRGATHALRTAGRAARGSFVFDEDYWGHVSADAKDLICKMIVVDQDARLTAKQAMLHPWLLAGDHEVRKKERKKERKK